MNTRLLTAITMCLNAGCIGPSSQRDDAGRISERTEISQRPHGEFEHGPCVDTIGGTLPTEGVIGNLTGLYALPDRRPDTLVVFAHGYGNRSTSWIPHLESAARDHGVVAVAMDYRGLGPAPDNRGWPVAAGAEDLITAANYFLNRCRSIQNVAILGISMGGNASGLAVAAGAKRPDSDRPLFDFWVDVEGAVNMTETYVEARSFGNASTFAHNVADDIEQETAGTPVTATSQYQERTVVARVADVATSGIMGIVLVHGVEDGTVPNNQSRELADSARALGLPYSLYTVLFNQTGDRNTTILRDIAPVADPLAGHGWEGDPTHPVIKTGFAQLYAVLGGAPIGPLAEYVIDAR